MGVNSNEMGVNSNKMGVNFNKMGVNSNKLGVNSDKMGVNSVPTGVHPARVAPIQQAGDWRSASGQSNASRSSPTSQTSATHELFTQRSLSSLLASRRDSGIPRFVKLVEPLHPACTEVGKLHVVSEVDFPAIFDVRDPMFVTQHPNETDRS